MEPEEEKRLEIKSGNPQEDKRTPGSTDDVTIASALSKKVKHHPHTEPNAGAGDPTDGRDAYEWNTRYPREAIIQIRLEALYLFLLFLSSYVIILAAWKGWASSLLSVSPSDALTLKKYLYYAASGMLGGVAFGIKYFYRVVARGYWHQDRRIWRLKSPFLAMTLSFIVGAMIDAGLIPTRASISSAAIVSTGFLVGYFADQAIAKMYEIAEVLFGKSAATKAGDGK
jgi:hypothetical protein